MSLDPNKTYLTWNGSEFPNSSEAKFKAPAGSSIDWGDGTVETFETASETVNTHTYTDGKDTHTISISGLTSIGGNAFSQCYSLTSIVIGNGITSIGYFAFYNCSSLTSIVIPDSVTSIGEDAFYNCSSLTSIVIPDSVTSIDKRAFSSCSNLQSIVIFAETPPTLGSYAIPSNVQSIYVTQSSKAAYQSATNWNALADKIVSDNLYLSFIRFNQKNKEYIDEKNKDLQPKVDETLETESKEVVGAINEVKGLAETARMVFGETEGTAYEGNKGKANADNIAKLQNEMAVVNLTLEQSGLVKKYKQPITQEYNERITADGLNVLDGSRAILKKVEGSTVACKNLFDISKISATSNVSKTDRDIIVTNSYDTDSGETLKELFPAVKAGITYTVACTVEANAPSYGSNGMITALGGTNILAPHHFESAGSAYVKQTVVFTEEDLTRKVFFYGLTDSITGVTNSTVKWKDLMLVEGDYTNTEMPPYQPYFTGLKSARFAGIESTNADGTETSTLAFPKTETPLGTTIDFENKKITNYGVELVLTGNENTGATKYVYEGITYNSILFFDILPAVEKRAKGVSTDGTIDTRGYYDVSVLWIGVNTTSVTWVGILDILGFTDDWADKSNPTAEEKATAVANFRAWLSQRYADGNPVTIRYVSSTLQSETDFTDGNEYTAYKGGTEKVLENDGNEYGADNTLTQDYILVTEV